MRKQHQRMILELLKTLEEAADDLKKLFSKKNFQSLTNLLSDCQSTAIQIGQFIESLEGEGKVTVTYLEEYCELLFHANEELNKSESGAGPIKKLQKQITKIENSVKHDLKPDKLEVVFFPYKASMWDALESIWLAAKDDPACDAYVVPIPYYDKQPAGDFGDMHFDGDKYPDYVPVVDWKEYNIEKRHPDAVFIHNPYDSFNRITSVHPDFYIEKIKKFTDLLVYVPYFVGTENVNKDLVEVPGVTSTDLVIVQSEKIRQEYISIFKEYENKTNNKGRFGNPHTKIKALGSPKFDKVINTKRENCELPLQWANLIEGKKVVLYNTTIDAILKDINTKNNRYFDKMRTVFDSFKERGDVVLWWRPHPLIEINLATLCPFHVVDSYRKIVEEYKQGGRGIFDDTADVHRAIAWSDAYYGDMSSLVAMYGITGKPVVIQNIEETETDVSLRFADFAVDDDGAAWGFELFTDGLFKLDFESNRAQLAMRSDCVPKYLGEERKRTHRYIGISCVGDQVVCLPQFLDNIMVYNRVSGETVKIPLNKDYLLSSDWSGFSLRWHIKYKEKIYTIGLRSKAVIVFNANNHSVRYDTALFDKIGLLTNTGNVVKYPLYISECSEDGKIILLMKNCKHLIRYTLQTQEVEFIATNPVLVNCLHADFDGHDFWLIVEKNEKIVRWNPNSDETTDYYMSANGFTFSNEDNVFSGISDYGSFLLLFPRKGCKLLKLDKITKQFSEYMEMPVPVDVNNKIWKYDPSKYVGNKIYAFARYNYTIYKYDKFYDKVTPHKFYLNKESYKSYYSEYFDSIKSAIKERNTGNIAVFFADSILDNKINHKRQEHFLSAPASPDGSCGAKIYEQIKKAIVG